MSRVHASRRGALAPLARAAFALAGAVSLFGASGGCGSSSRPPPLANPEAASDGGTTNTFTASAPTVQSCKLGPGGGVCACADEPLVGDPPTLYFVLDRSGSMLTDGKWATIIQVLGDSVVALGPRAKIGAAVFPASSDVDDCAPGGEVFPPTQGDAPAGLPGPVETSLLQTLGHIDAVGGTPTAATLQELLASRLKTLPGKTYVILATDGGPNCGVTSCDISSCELNIENAPGCAPGGPVNCCAGNFSNVQSCLDAQPTEDAVTAIAAAGFPVYVIGVPGSAPYASLLDRLAIEGGTASSGAHAYYDVGTADQSAFTAAIFTIAAKITGTCTLTLSQAPPDRTLVNVFLDEKPLAQQAASGASGASSADGDADAGTVNWTLVGTTVTILGFSCQAILAGSVVDVRVVAGCPTVEH